MTPDQVSQAIASALSDGGEQVPEGTLAAVLPILMPLMLEFHQARRYMLNVVQKFLLRLGADTSSPLLLERQSPIPMSHLTAPLTRLHWRTAGALVLVATLAWAVKEGDLVRVRIVSISNLAHPMPCTATTSPWRPRMASRSDRSCSRR